MKFSLLAFLAAAATGAVAAQCQEGAWYSDRVTKEPCKSECEGNGGTCVYPSGCEPGADGDVPTLCWSTCKC